MVNRRDEPIEKRPVRGQDAGRSAVNGDID